MLRGCKTCTLESILMSIKRMMRRLRQSSSRRDKRLLSMKNIMPMYKWKPKVVFSQNSSLKPTLCNSLEKRQPVLEFKWCETTTHRDHKDKCQYSRISMTSLAPYLKTQSNAKNSLTNALDISFLNQWLLLRVSQILTMTLHPYTVRLLEAR